MFTAPNNRLSASNRAVLASQSFLVPVTLWSAGKTSQAAFDGLRQAFAEMNGFVTRLASAAPGIAVLALDEVLSPRMSRIEVAVEGKEHQHTLTCVLKCPIPQERDFWERIRLISLVYDRLTEFGAGFQDKKSIMFFLDKARLDEQRDDAEQR